MAGTKAGDRVPVLMLRADRLADTGLVTVMIYVFVVTPSCAVDTMVITLAPGFKAIGADATPEAVVTPLIFRVAVASCSVALTVILFVVMATVVV